MDWGIIRSGEGWRRVEREGKGRGEGRNVQL